MFDILLLTNNLVYLEYFPILIYIGLSFFLAAVIFLAGVLVSPKNAYLEKVSAYECGFDPYEDARSPFDVQFYLVSLLFIIFDIEAALLFPWAVSLSQLQSFGFWVMIDFMVELVLGFYFAWVLGALEWGVGIPLLKNEEKNKIFMLSFFFKIKDNSFYIF